MSSRLEDLVEKLEHALVGGGLNAPLKIDLGAGSLVCIDGTVVSRAEDAAAGTVLTASLDVFADICAGRTDPVQAYYEGRLRLRGSESLAMQLFCCSTQPTRKPDASAGSRATTVSRALPRR